MLKQPITVTITVKKSLILEFDKADQPEESRFLDAIWQKDKSPFVYTIFTNWHHDFICPSLPGVLSIIADHVYFSHRLPSWFLCQLSRWIINAKAGNHCRFNAYDRQHTDIWCTLHAASGGYLQPDTWTPDWQAGGHERQLHISKLDYNRETPADQKVLRWTALSPSFSYSFFDTHIFLNVSRLARMEPLQTHKLTSFSTGIPASQGWWEAWQPSPKVTRSF